MKMTKILPLAILASIGLSGCASLFGNQDNVARPSALVTFTPSKHAQQLWRNQPTHGSHHQYLQLDPKVTSNVVYTAGIRGELVATDAQNGKVLWRQQLNEPITSGPAAGEGIVVVGTGNAHVIAVDPSTGKRRWDVDVSNEVLAPPTIAAKRVLVKTIDGMLYAFDATDGHELWQYKHGAPSLILRASSAPQVAGNQVIAGFSDGKIASHALNDGHLQWQVPVAKPSGGSPVEQMIDIDAQPVIKGNTIYVVTYQGNIAALTLKKGRILWQHHLSSYSGLTVDNNKIYATDTDGDVWAFKRDNGVVLWRQRQLFARRLSAPVVQANAVVVGDIQGYLHWLDKSDGHFIARTRIAHAPIQVAPARSEQDIVALASDGVLTRLRLTV